ncbi:GlcNAc-PI de-N-acetylase family protein [Fictibacillus macauensis ZFHKF-1]|uniref:GlcNAc-PI de-N-acetylase family protein n=1 Tax=Fictibacillus macauensis ZFHKF-1 TaxID=1196324 RepID=I8J386_9BACL|nr:PIG-L deacetylase family protein [Fictibacillus macauensis]EIT86221.1 GlcNAc-PI de-N-acetylase family protein [Fictibacillus macauensis ZFHKF-1]
MKESILVIGAHPDDELLGSAGTLKRLIAAGHDVISVITAMGRKEEAHHMEETIRRANKAIGIETVIFLQHPNLELEMMPRHQLTKDIEKIIAQYKPSTVFTHHYGDVNRDHLVTYEAVLTAVRPLPGQRPIEFITFETVSSSEWSASTSDKLFKPNYFVDITNEIDVKIEALKHYDVEMRPPPHPRSYEGVRNLASVRGMTIGVPYAEAFEVIRRVWK